MKPAYTFLLRKHFNSKRFYLFLVILLVLAFRVVTECNSITRQEIITVYYGIINDKSMQFFIIPFFLLFSESALSLFDNNMVLLRYHSAGLWWNEKTCVVSCLAVICTLMFNTIFFGCVIKNGQINVINMGFIGFIVLGIAMQITGFLIIGTFYNLITLQLNKYMSFLITMLIIFLFDAVTSVFRVNFVTLQEYMALTYKWHLGFYTSVAGDIILVLRLFFIFIVLYLLGFLLSQSKDYYWSV